MGKKIGILTFHSAVNYGAALQAVALYKKLDELGGDATFIDYEDLEFKKVYGIQKNFDPRNIIVKIPLIIVKNIMFQIKKDKFIRFIKQNSRLSNVSYDEKNISDTADKYDLFITGSDQVFNMNLTGNDSHYFLDFAPEDKIYSYAASFGFEKLPDNLSHEEYKSLLERFNDPSLREESGVKLFEEITSKEGHKDVDPTLLFDGGSWARFLNLKKTERRKYILLYTVALPDKLIEEVKKEALEKDLDVIEITPKIEKCDKSFIAKRFCSPKDFVELIYNSEMVATTSFHASVFATLFHKKAIFEVIDRTSKRNTRILNLLKITGFDYEEGTSIVKRFDFDESRIDELLSKEREESVKYLERIIK